MTVDTGAPAIEGPAQEGTAGPAAGLALPPMTFAVPEGLHAVELPLDRAERTRAVASLVRDMYPKGDPDLWTAMQAVYGPLTDELVDAGVAFTGIGLYDLGERRIGHCSLTVGALECEQHDPEVTAHGIREMYGRQPLHEVSWLDLPCGPAVAVTTTRETVIDGSVTSSGADVTVTSGQVQVWVPFPKAPFIAVFTLETMAAEHFEEFGVMLSIILASVDFPDEDEPGVPG